MKGEGERAARGLRGTAATEAAQIPHELQDGSVSGGGGLQMDDTGKKLPWDRDPRYGAAGGCPERCWGSIEHAERGGGQTHPQDVGCQLIQVLRALRHGLIAPHGLLLLQHEGRETPPGF